MGSFVCGETLCKSAFDADVDPSRPWPVRCPKCARSLYPAEVLASPQAEELDANRAPLMKRYGGKLVDVGRDELGRNASKAAPSLLDQIAADADARVARGERKPRTALWLGAAFIVVVVVAILAWVATR